MTKSKLILLFDFSIAADLVGKDDGYLQNWLQELTHERDYETRRAGYGELILRPQNRQGILISYYGDSGIF